MEKIAKRVKFKVLKKNQVPLTPEERAEVIKRKAVWGGSIKGQLAVWKSVDKKTGETTYVTHTHRAFNTAPTLKGAIGRFHSFIKSTASETVDDRIEKMAMALSKRNFEAARQAFGRWGAELRGNIGEGMAGTDKLLSQKLMGTKDSVNSFKRMKKGLPHGDTMLHKDTHAKHLFPGSEAEAKRIDDYRRKIIGTDGVMRNPNGESYRKVRAAGFKLAKKNSFDSTHNIVTASPVHNAVASHELGHASRLNKDPFESYLDAVDMEHGEPLRQSMGNKEHSDVVKHIKNAYRDGNKNSKEVGRRLLGAYNEARKKGNDELMNEIHANAWSYNKLHELHGKDIADKSLDSNLYSNLTYALSAAQKGNKKAKDLVSHMTQSPIKTKKKMVDPRAIYNLRRDSGVVSKRK